MSPRYYHHYYGTYIENLENTHFVGPPPRRRFIIFKLLTGTRLHVVSFSYIARLPYGSKGNRTATMA